jgi:hypothetical protein
VSSTVDRLALAPSEADVVHLTRALVGLLPSRAALELLSTPRKRVAIGRDAIGLLEDALRKGFIRALARRGGGLPQRHLDGTGGTTRRGRLWERCEPPTLLVSRRSAALLEWLLTTPVLSTPHARSIAGPLTAGDELFFYLTAERLVELGLGDVLKKGPFKASLLTRVAFPIFVGPAERDFTKALTEEPLQLLIFGLERDLAAKIVATEVLRRRSSQEAALLEAEESIRRGPVGLVSAALALERPDLGLFVLRAIGRMLETTPDPTVWMPAFSATLPLSRRERLARTAAVWLEVVDAFRPVARRASARGFVDENYEASQHLLGELEPWTRRGFAQAETLGRALSSFTALSVVATST